VSRPSRLQFTNAHEYFVAGSRATCQPDASRSVAVSSGSAADTIAAVDDDDDDHVDDSSTVVNAVLAPAVEQLSRESAPRSCVRDADHNDSSSSSSSSDEARLGLPISVR